MQEKRLSLAVCLEHTKLAYANANGVVSRANVLSCYRSEHGGFLQQKTYLCNSPGG